MKKHFYLLWNIIKPIIIISDKLSINNNLAEKIKPHKSVRYLWESKVTLEWEFFYIRLKDQGFLKLNLYNYDLLNFQWEIDYICLIIQLWEYKGYINREINT